MPSARKTRPAAFRIGRLRRIEADDGRRRAAMIDGLLWGLAVRGIDVPEATCADGSAFGAFVRPEGGYFAWGYSILRP